VGFILGFPALKRSRLKIGHLPRLVEQDRKGHLELLHEGLDIRDRVLESQVDRQYDEALIFVRFVRAHQMWHPQPTGWTLACPEIDQREWAVELG